MPGHATSAATLWCGSEPGSRPMRLLATSPANDRMLAATADRSPSFASDADGTRASRSAEGATRSSSANGVSIVSPYAAANRPESVVAARTEICCPRIARTANSKPSNAPGTRRPGTRHTMSAILPCEARHSAITSGRADRSKRCFIFARAAGRTGSNDVANSTDSPLRPVIRATLIQPRCAPICAVRKYASSTTASTPGIARAARNRNIDCHANGGR